MRPGEGAGAGRNEERSGERTIRYFGTHFMSRSVFMPQILAPPRGHLRSLPVESSPIFTTVPHAAFYSLLSRLDFLKNVSKLCREPKK